MKKVFAYLSVDENRDRLAMRVVAFVIIFGIVVDGYVITTSLIHR